jgi:hypothetical protein
VRREWGGRAGFDMQECSGIRGRPQTVRWPLTWGSNGARTAHSSTRGVTVQRSDADDVDEIAEPGEVVGISGVEREAVSVRGGGDEQVGDTPSM